MEPRDYMELAVSVMKDSMAEPRDDGKLSPFVGAVLVKPNGSMDQACRGELRDGDHAEFTLLERKNRDNRLDGSVLYVTLEPCAPGARGERKLSCAERVVLARIKKVYVGVADPDPLVDRRGIKYLQDHGVEVVMFDRDLQEAISNVNQPFFDQALERAQQAAIEADEPTSLSTLDQATVGALSDLDASALNLYRARAKIQPKVGTRAFEERLAQQGVLTMDAAGVFRPSAFGLMLFGTHPRAAIPQAGLLATIRYPDGRVETRDFEGPLVLIPEALEDWLEGKLPHVISRNRMERETVQELPFEVVREAVVNALVHRDYDVEGAKCQLSVDADTVVVRSPGRPVPPITIAQLQAFNAPMLSRNPRLHYTFAKMRLAEERGLGLNSLAQQAKKHGLPLPRYQWDDPYLILTLFRSADAAIAVLPAHVVESMSSSQAVGWKWFAAAGVATSSEYATAMSVGVRTARRHLAAFVELGLARTEGTGPSTVYRTL
ncbi:MAG: ATP-binding protein [Coriobacteriia bacterium]|nr:ATP-binding protein [Coriobacteriia bacterium]